MTPNRLSLAIPEQRTTVYLYRIDPLPLTARPLVNHEADRMSLTTVVIGGRRSVSKFLKFVITLTIILEALTTFVNFRNRVEHDEAASESFDTQIPHSHTIQHTIDPQSSQEG